MSAHTSFRRRVRAAAAAAAVIAAAGCSGVLDVDNPNNVLEEALDNVASAEQQANGVLASLTRMLANIEAPYGVATDELDWIGSREGWRGLEEGVISNPNNEFTDAAFPYVGEARFLGDETIARLEKFRVDSVGRDAATQTRVRGALSNAYLYTAIVYGTIADTFDDFPLGSTRREGGPAAGEANMVQLYDTAVAYLDRALPLAANADARYRVLSTRARTKHARSVWALVNPKGSPLPANPYVNNAGANADAAAALAVQGGDALYRVSAPAANVAGTLQVFFEVNGRNEMRVGTAYQNLRDPISGAADPALARLVTDFRTSPQQGNVYLTSNRELRLILAEAALSAGNTAEFTTQINALRALDSKPAYTGQVAAGTLLQHERKVNLWMQRRRLSDLYRFGERVVEWRADPNYASAFNTRGLFFPIPVIELQSNPCLATPPAAGCGG